MGTGPHGKIASLMSEAMGKINSMPHLFSALVYIIEKRSGDEAFISLIYIRCICTELADHGEESRRRN